MSVALPSAANGSINMPSPLPLHVKPSYTLDKKSFSTVTPVPSGATMGPQKTMKALRIFKEHSHSHNTQGVISLQAVDMPTPAVTAGMVLVRIMASLINPSDAGNANGYFPYTTFPRIPGRDYAGVVITGPRHLQGQRVFGTSGRDYSFSKDGAHAEYCVVPEDAVVIMPADLSFTQAATIGVPFTTAWLAIERANTKSTDTVLVIGAFGAVGSAACQIARSRGCRVITAARRDTADIDLTADPHLKGAKALTGGLGPNVVVDTVGDPQLMRRALSSLSVHGRLSYMSAPKTFDAEFSFDMRNLYRTEKIIVGCNSLAYSVQEMADILRELAPGFAKGGPYQTFDASQIVSVKLGEEALEAYKTVKAAESGKLRKYVICAE